MTTKTGTRSALVIPQPWGEPSPHVAVAFPYPEGSVCPVTGEPEDNAGGQPKIIRFCEASEHAYAVKLARGALGDWAAAAVYSYDPERGDYARTWASR